MKICAPHGAHHVRPCTRLTEFINAFNLPSASAKSEARYWRIGNQRRNNRHQCDFFVARIPVPAFYGGCLGAGEIRGGLPLSRYANPVTTATLSDIGVSVGWLYIKGACPMRTYTLAVLAGDGRYFSTSYVHHFCQLSACSLSEANDIAARIGAVVIAWRAA